MVDLDAQIAGNLARVRERIASAAERCGRASESIKLVAVTKYADAAATGALIAAGCHDLGESRPQQLWSKAQALEHETVRWHFIGHLQRNKIRATLPLVSLLHSVDSERLLAAVNQEAQFADRPIDALLEVNISGETAKHGLEPGDVGALLARAAEFPCVRIRGLMGMASLTGGLPQAQRDFARLRELRDGLRCDCPAEVSLDELSMGMSQDFEAAIAAGATLVRVGSALFEGLPEIEH